MTLITLVNNMFTVVAGEPDEVMATIRQTETVLKSHWVNFAGETYFNIDSIVCVGPYDSKRLKAAGIDTFHAITS